MTDRSSSLCGDRGIIMHHWGMLRVINVGAIIYRFSLDARPSRRLGCCK